MGHTGKLIISLATGENGYKLKHTTVALYPEHGFRSAKQITTEKEFYNLYWKLNYRKSC